MSKIDLKYIAAYLPYDLKGLFLPYEKQIIRKLTEENIVDFRCFCKPILKPLSDLHQEIDLEYEYLGKYNFANAFKVDDRPCGTQALPRYFFELLLSKRYDVFNLIEQGKAIDINLLNSDSHE